jgi:hypothetical protein
MAVGPVPELGPHRLLLVGADGPQAAVTASARDVYLGSAFTQRRALAEDSGRPWYILSARWGLVQPEELIAPYDVALADRPRMYRRAWGRYVAEQLAHAFALQRGTLVEIHADDLYVDSLRSSLEHLELIVIVSVDAESVRESIAG